jgi:hypothetical protein
MECGQMKPEDCQLLKNRSKAAGQLQDEYANYFFRKGFFAMVAKINSCRIIET